MRPIRRSHVNKRRSTRSFSRGASRTRSINVSPGLQRGGIRL